MAYNEVAWDYPKISAYSILNAAVHPAICWQPLQNNPFIGAFDVDYLDIENKLWVNIGRTSTNYIRFPNDDYTGQATYQIRIATIGINGIRSPYVYSKVAFSSPLSFDFTTNQIATTTAGFFIINRHYTIATVGTTDFTAIGASTNTVGVIFAATGVGDGTGTATSEPTVRLINGTEVPNQRYLFLIL